MAGYVLVLAMLLLGGVIATIGDRLGTKVGKARLSLWGMRPRKTAVAITILTGSIISASTLGILFAMSEQLRTGVFELGTIQRKLRKARTDLEETQNERQRLEKERDEARSEQVVARSEQAIAQKRLRATRETLGEAVALQKQTESQRDIAANRAIALRQEAERLQQERSELIRQRDVVVEQIQQRNQQISQRDQEISQQEARLGQQDTRIASQGRAIAQQKQAITEQKQAINEQEQAITEQEEAIASQQSDLEAKQKEIVERDETISTQLAIEARGKEELKNLEQNKRLLEEAIRRQEQELLRLRQGNVAITRGEVLASRILRVIVPSATSQAFDLVLRQANQAALERVSPGVDDRGDAPQVQIIQIPQAEVERVRREIEDGREYVVRILAAGNYVRGEKDILVFTDVVPNQVIFDEDIVLATTSVKPRTMDTAQVRERINLLIGASQFRAQRAGLIAEQTFIGDGSGIDGIASVEQFYERILAEDSPLSLKAVTSVPVYTAGPLRIDLIALRDGVELFRTSETDIRLDDN